MSEQLTEVPEHGVGVNPSAQVERRTLDDGSWVDISRGWLSGADALYDSLLQGVPWQSSRLFRYDHWVEEKRLGSFWSRGRPLPHPALAEVTRTLQRNYKARFEGFGMIQYRDGGDGQGFHRDTDMRWLDDTIIAILTLGATRPWLLRPRSTRTNPDSTWTKDIDLAPGNGDLIVMGGRCQADWLHSVPYLTGRKVGIRISLQWRHARRTGRPYAGSSYSAPLHYSRR